MIEKNGIFYELQCDYCSNCETEFDDFYETVDYKKANGWKSVKENDEYFDKCPGCVRKDLAKEFK